MAELVVFQTHELELIEKQLNLQGLSVTVSASWGSRASEHRKQIHQAIQSLKDQGENFDHSISHCPGLGGFTKAFISSQDSFQIGFDIEEDERVRDDIAKRVCRNEHEFLQAPSPASLWAAKEAAYKALKGPRQPLVVTELELTNWQKINSHFEAVEIRSPQLFGYSQIKGVVLKKKPFTFAFFVARA